MGAALGMWLGSIAILFVTALQLWLSQYVGFGWAILIPIGVAIASVVALKKPPPRLQKLPTVLVVLKTLAWAEFGVAGICICMVLGIVD